MINSLIEVKTNFHNMTAYVSQNSKNDNNCVAEIVIMCRKNR